MKILLVDDHALFREGMRYVLQQLPEEVEILEAGNFAEGLRLAKEHPDLDLALLDLYMPGSEGPASIRYFHQCHPQIPVAVISGEDNINQMEKVMNYGAMGFIGKSSSAPVTLKALNTVLSGGVYVPPEMLKHHGMMAEKEMTHTDRRSSNTNEYGLTQRQMQVLTYLATGLSNKEISEAIHIAEGTVKIHVAAVYQILRVSNRMEAVRVAEKLGLVGPHV